MKNGIRTGLFGVDAVLYMLPVFVYVYILNCIALIILLPYCA